MAKLPATKEPVRQRRPRQRKGDHLEFIRSLPCAVCGTERDIEAAHVRGPAPTFGKALTGVGVKPDDRWTVPLCAYHHRTSPYAQHAMGERLFWYHHAKDPHVLALALWFYTGDYDMAVTCIKRAR